MSTSNKVFQVLVTSGNQAIAVKGTQLDALLPGQLGFYDSDTNVAVDGTEVPVPQSWYAALGLGPAGGPLKDVRFSSGQEIQTKGIMHHTFNKYVAGTPTIIDITGIFAKCSSDYSLKVEARSIDILNMFGFKPYFKSYSIQTSCCEGCEPCPSGSKAEVAGKLVKEVNKDPEAFVTALLLVDGAPVASDNAAIDTFMADPANKDANVGIRLTSKVNPVYAVNSSMLPIVGFDGAAVSAFLGNGFECTGTVTVVQAGTQAEGAGHFIREKEYVAGGYQGNHGIYRTTGEFNTAYPQATILASEGTNYDQINLVYDHHSKAGWGDYLNDQNTLIAIPTTDTVTTTAALAALSKLTAPAGLAAVTTTSPEAENA